MRLIVLRAGDAVKEVAARRGEFFSWIRREGEPAWPGEWREHDVRTDAPLPGAREADGFVVTGSSSSVTERAPWMLRTEAFLREVASAGTPLFGICFGHQLVGQALGGEVARNPRGREIGTVRVRVLARDPILEGLGDAFDANHTHVDSVVKLPAGATILAETDLEPNAAFAIGASIKCVQFHPEIDGDAMRGYIAARAHLITAEGRDPAPLLAGARDAPAGAETLRNFLRSVANAKAR